MAVTRESRSSCSGTLVTRTVSLRSTISPRGAATLTTRTWLRVTAAAYDFPSMICSVHSRRTRTRNRTRTTTPTTRRRRFGRDGSSSGEPTSEATLTLLRGRMRGWRALPRPTPTGVAVGVSKAWDGGDLPGRGGAASASPEAALRRAGRHQRAPVPFCDQRPPHQAVDGKHQHRARDSDDEEEREEVDLHHLLLAEDGAEHGEQHVGRHAADDRGHRLGATRPGDRRPPSPRRWRNPSRQPTSAPRPNGVGSTRSKARPDQNPTMAPVSGPASSAAVIGRSHTMSGCMPPTRIDSITVDWTRSSKRATRATRSVARALTPGAPTRRRRRRPAD